MSSCAVSCCTCFPKASSAFGTSDSWQSQACHHRATLPLLARLANRSHARGFHPQSMRSLALPQLWWADARHPTIHGCRYSTTLPPLQSRLLHEATIPSRLLWVPRHSPSLASFRATNVSFALLIVIHDRPTCPANHSPATSSVLLPSANSAGLHPHTPDHSFPIDARVCRNHGRPRSNGFIKRAQSGPPNFALGENARPIHH